MLLALTLLLSACSKPAPVTTVAEEEQTTVAGEETSSDENAGEETEEESAELTENDKIMQEIGLLKYYDMLQTADAEYNDLDKRYELYAEAEAFLLDNAIVLPKDQQMRGLIVSRVVPFTHVRGITEVSLKYLQLQDDIVTTEQYEKAMADWEARKLDKNHKMDRPEPGEDRVYTYFYESDPETLNYLTSSKNPDFKHTGNFISGLYAYNEYNELVPDMAESFEVSEDGMTYTFHLRDANWVTATGEVYAPVTADDWVTATEYLVEQDAPTLWLLDGVVANLREYMDGEVDIEEVGVKAVDEHTLQYTLTHPAPYFLSMTTYSVMFPLNREFINSKGEDFGITQPDGILYNGPFICSEMTAKSKIAYTKNPNYWDKDNVHLSEVNLIFDDGKDVKSGINGFESGTYVQSSLRPSWEDFDEYVKKYEGKAYASLPNSTTFALNPNYNRRATKYTNKDEQGLKDTHDAIMNKNFRKALQASFGRMDYLLQTMPKEVAVGSMRNIWTYPELVQTSKGEIYGSLVTKAYNKLTGENKDLADAVEAYEDKEAALKYIEAAKADGVNFPVTLDIIAIDIESYMNRLNSLKQSIEANSEGNILIDLHVMNRDEASAILFGTQNPAEKDYDINWFAGWGPDYADPKNFLDVYNPVDGATLNTLGLDPASEAVTASEE